MKEYFEKFLELWAIPRYKAIIKLALYFIFFTLVILSIRVEPNNKNQNIEKPKFKINSNYMKEYNSLITYNNKIYEHIKTDNKETLKIDDVIYDVNLNILDNGGQRLQDDFVIKFWRFTPEVIDALIKKANLDRETTDYKLECNIIDYSVNLRILFEKINSGYPIKPGVNIDEEELNFQIYEKNDKIIKVIINVTNYKNMFVDNQTEEKIVIEYK